MAKDLFQQRVDTEIIARFRVAVQSMRELGRVPLGDAASAALDWFLRQPKADQVREVASFMARRLPTLDEDDAASSKIQSALGPLDKGGVKATAAPSRISEKGAVEIPIETRIRDMVEEVVSAKLAEVEAEAKAAAKRRRKGL